MTCDRCKKEAAIATVVGDIALCHACCPLGRRCQKCPAGVLKIAATPNDMGRMRCDSCNRIGYQRRLLR